MKKEAVAGEIDKAIYANNYEAVWKIINKDRSILSKKITNGNFPIGYASIKNKEAALCAIIDYGDDIERCDPDDNHTALYLAAYNGSYNCAKILLENGASVNVAEEFYAFTPIHWASKFGFLDLVQLLIANGADIDAINHENQTALHLACAEGKMDVVEILLKNGARTDMHDIFGKKPKCV